MEKDQSRSGWIDGLGVSVSRGGDGIEDVERPGIGDNMDEGHGRVGVGVSWCLDASVDRG